MDLRLQLRLLPASRLRHQHQCRQAITTSHINALTHIFLRSLPEMIGLWHLYKVVALVSDYLSGFKSNGAGRHVASVPILSTFGQCMSEFHSRFSRSGPALSARRRPFPPFSAIFGVPTPPRAPNPSPAETATSTSPDHQLRDLRTSSVCGFSHSSARSDGKSRERPRDGTGSTKGAREGPLGATRPGRRRGEFRSRGRTSGELCDSPPSRSELPEQDGEMPPRRDTSSAWPATDSAVDLTLVIV